MTETRRSLPVVAIFSESFIYGYQNAVKGVKWRTSIARLNYDADVLLAGIQAHVDVSDARLGA